MASYRTPEHDAYCRRAIRDLIGCVRFWRGIGAHTRAMEVLQTISHMRAGLLKANVNRGRTDD